jgi:hypothetical protein
MPAAIALGSPFLGDHDGEPMLLCKYALLPTGTMLDADQLMYGQIGAVAVLSPRQPAAMVVPAGNLKLLFPESVADGERTRPFEQDLADEFEQHLFKLQLLEDLTAHG